MREQSTSTPATMSQRIAAINTIVKANRAPRRRRRVLINEWLCTHHPKDSSSNLASCELRNGVWTTNHSRSTTGDLGMCTTPGTPSSFQRPQAKSQADAAMLSVIFDLQLDVELIQDRLYVEFIEVGASI